MPDKTVLVTGSTTGIGYAMAKRFASVGYNVVINCAWERDVMDGCLTELRGITENVAGILADVSDYEQVKSMFERLPPSFGEIDVLVNNAAIAHVGLFTDMSPDQWRRIIDTNLLSIFNCCHCALPGMIRRRCGSVINISSIWGGAGASCEAVYAASKGGVDSFTKSLAKELAPSNVRVNAVACGVIDTRMNSFLSPEERAALADAIPMGRFGTAEEIAETVFFLSSPASSYLTGQIITVDGGMC